MRHRIVWGVVAAALAASACYTSPNPRVVRAATDPGGVDVVIIVGRVARLHGELLAATDSAVVVKTLDNRLMSIEYQAVDRIQLVSATRRSAGQIRLGDVAVGRQSRLPSSDVDQLRMWSRFPHGLADSVIEQLLRDSGQSALDVVTAFPPPSGR